MSQPDTPPQPQESEVTTTTTETTTPVPPPPPAAAPEATQDENPEMDTTLAGSFIWDALMRDGVRGSALYAPDATRPPASDVPRYVDAAALAKFDAGQAAAAEKCRAGNVLHAAEYDKAETARRGQWLARAREIVRAGAAQPFTPRRGGQLVPLAAQHAADAQQRSSQDDLARWSDGKTISESEPGQ